jgi:hypothetical protein
MRQLGCVAIACALCLAVAVEQAHAQAGPTSVPTSQLGRAFQDMLQDMANPVKAQAYAQEAVAAGQLRSAVAALERILRLNPNDASTHLQLGMIYYDLGSLALAAQHFSAATEGEGISFDQQFQATRYLQAIQTRVNAQTLSASVFTGIRYDSNVVQSPYTNTSELAGQIIPVTTAMPKGEWAWVGGGNLFHRYQLGAMDAALETNASVYGSKEFESQEFDTAYGTLDTGPRFDLGRIDDVHFSGRPFAQVAYDLYGGDAYFWAVGPGINVQGDLSLDSSVALTLALTKRHFANSVFRPQASLQSDTITSGLVAYQHWLGERQQVQVGAGLGYDQTLADSVTNQFWAVNLGYTIFFQGFETLAGNRVWSAGLQQRYVDTKYEAPDPAIDAGRARHDQLSDTIGSITIPITNWLAGSFTLEYQLNYSNIVNYRYDNKAAYLTFSFHN